MRQAKLILIVGAVGIGLAVAVYRVSPYVLNPREKLRDEQKKQTIQIVESVVPDYDIDGMRNHIDELRNSLIHGARATLLELPSGQKPTAAEASLIALSFADFVSLSSTGTLQEFLAYYEGQDLVPPKQLMRDDVSRSERSWLKSTAWARHQPLAADTVRVIPRYIDGVEVSEPPYDNSNGGLIRSRPLRAGGFLMIDGPLNYSAYEILLQVMAPSLDGKEAFSVELGLVLINDGLQGKWSVIESRFIGVPKGKTCFVPYP